MSGLLLAQKSGEAVKAGPIGLAVILLLCIACYFLFKSMSRHMRNVRENFPAEAPGTASATATTPTRPTRPTAVPTPTGASAASAPTAAPAGPVDAAAVDAAAVDAAPGADPASEAAGEPGGGADQSR